MGQSLRTMLDKFLGKSKRKRAADGGWPEVTDDELTELAAIVRALIDARYQRDSSGDPAVEFALVNRTTHQRLFYKPMPYEHDAETEDDLLGLLSIATFNLSIAAREVDLLARLLDDMRRARVQKSQLQAKQGRLE